MLKELTQFAQKYPAIKNLKWYKAGNWKSPLLRKQVHFRGYIGDYFQRFTGIDWRFRFGIHLEPDQYDCDEAFEDMIIQFEKRVEDDPGYLTILSRRFLEIVKLNEDFGNKISTTDFSKLSNKESWDLFNEFLETYCQFMPYSAIWLDKNDIARRIVKRILGDIDDFDAIYRQIMIPKQHHENNFTKAQKLLYKIRLAIENSNSEEQIKESTAKYREHFGWLHIRHWVGDIPTDEEVRELAEHAKQVASKEESKAEPAEDLLVSLTDAEKEIIGGLREQIYLKTHRKEMMSKVDYMIRPLFFEMGKRMSLKLDEFIYCTLEEIQDYYVENIRPDKKRIEERRRSYALLVVNSEIHAESGIEKKEASSNCMRSVKGITAYPGKIKGTAKIVLDSSSLKKVNEGDILVADMTNPDLIAGVNKAAGIITNRGGALCHAAIISREMNKPCIIGTNNATEVFQDGDYVMLDAEKGYAKKLKN